MRIMVVCGFGLGSSMILKMKLDEVLRQNDIKAKTFHSDVTTARGQSYDLLLTSNELADRFKNENKPMVIIDNFLDKDEIQQKAIPVIRKLMAQEG